MDKKKVLILSSSQFGYLTDVFKYCEYAGDKFDITYVGWDHDRARIEIPGITVKYVTRGRGLLVRNINLLRAFHNEIKKGYDVVFATYSRGISVVKLLNKHVRFVMDIRTLCVDPGRTDRFFYNLFLKLETLFFENITVISHGVAGKLKLRDYQLLPLGGECYTSGSKSFERLSLLYVGTLENRNILDCVKGFHLYLDNPEPGEPAPLFTIVGDSSGNELREIKDYINKFSLNNNIITTGTIPQTKLKPYFEKANIGISYIPIRSYFKYQPPTKTFEYLISGLPVLGTATYENKNIVGDKAGVLIEDNAEAFFKGIKEVFASRKKFNSDVLRKEYSKFCWENIVNEKFVLLIEELCG